MEASRRDLVAAYVAMQKKMQAALGRKLDEFVRGVAKSDRLP